MLGFGMCSCEIKYKFYGQPQLPSNYQVLAWLVFVNVVILISCRIVIPIAVRSVILISCRIVIPIAVRSACFRASINRM